METQPDARTVERVARLAGAPPSSWRLVGERGYTPAERWIVGFEDGRTAFAKIATTDLTVGWLRTERVVYDSLPPTFAPRLLGWEDDDERPILLLEHLDGGEWPPPWSEERVERVLGTLDQIHETPCPPHLLPVEETGGLTQGWDVVATEPAPFLSLGLCSEAWLERALPVLAAVDPVAAMHGDRFLHVDVRSDNICFVGDRTVFVDWNWAARGSPWVDVVTWTPSLASEGYAGAFDIARDHPELLAVTVGFFAARAGLPEIPTAPRVRAVQLEQLRASLPWLIKVFDLPPLDAQPTDRDERL